MPSEQNLFCPCFSSPSSSILLQHHLPLGHVFSLLFVVVIELHSHGIAPLFTVALLDTALEAITTTSRTLVHLKPAPNNLLAQEVLSVT